MSDTIKIILKNARIIDPASNWDSVGDILIEGGRVAAIGHLEPVEGCPQLDLKGMWILPGLIDMHVHFREPGQEYKETLATGSKAAAAGGFTAVCTMPNTSPPNDSAAVTRFMIERGHSAGLCRIFPVAAITKGQEGRELTEFGDLLQAGAVAFSDDGVPVADAAIMRMALDYARNFNALLISHSEELALSENGCMNEGRVSSMLGLKGIPSAAEEIAVFRDICLCKTTNSRLHIAHVSTKGAVELIRRAKSDGIEVSAETAPHYFILTEDAVGEYDTNAKMNPPLRTEEDRLAIIEGLADGTIDAIATDHAPHSALDKDLPFQAAANGISGLETSLPLALELVRQGRLMPSRLADLMSTSPARLLGLPLGRIAEGMPADLTVIDPEIEYSLGRDDIFTKGKNSPFLGRPLKGRAVLTLLEGRPTYDPMSLWPETG